MKKFIFIIGALIIASCSHKGNSSDTSIKNEPTGNDTLQYNGEYRYYKYWDPISMIPQEPIKSNNDLTYPYVEKKENDSILTIIRHFATGSLQDEFVKLNDGYYLIHTEVVDGINTIDTDTTRSGTFNYFERHYSGYFIRYWYYNYSENVMKDCEITLINFEDYNKRVDFELRNRFLVKDIFNIPNLKVEDVEFVSEMNQKHPEERKSTQDPMKIKELLKLISLN